MKLLIIVLATIAFVCILRAFMPSSDNTAILIGTFPIKYWSIAAACFAVFASRVK